MISALPSLSVTYATPDSGQATARAETEASQRARLEQQAQLGKLAATDREVRAHEAAHLAAAGGLALSGASFGYTRGPDGQNYAVSGEVSIDTSPASTPEATLAKAQQIRSAALAPANPSGQDLQVASAAAAMASAARIEIARQQAAQYSAQAETPGSRIDTLA